MTRATAALLAASVSAAAVAQPSPDLELVALQTSGPGRIGVCNGVVARLRNAGAAPTAGAPEVRLVVNGAETWSRTAPASGPLAAGETVEVWFHDVPLAGGILSTLEATADPADRVRESNEANNARRVDREPRVACGAPAEPTPGRELRVRVRRRGDTTGEAMGIGGATVTVSSVLGAGAVVAEASTADDGSAVVTLPSAERSPVLRVAVTAEGCAPEALLATLAGPPAQGLDLDVELSCAAEAVAPPASAPGHLEIETALPGRLRLDDDEPMPVGPGTRVTVRRPGGSVRVRLASANGTTFHDAEVAVPTSRALALVVDAPPIRAVDGADAVEDLRSGLFWSVGATSSASYSEATARCDALDRAGAEDWRLPTIDELGFVLRAVEASAAPPPGLRGLSPCCLWSTTEHAVGGQLTFYLEGGHIYGRRPEEAGVGALCVRGAAYDLDPLRVPERYRDRLPGQRSFRPSP